MYTYKRFKTSKWSLSIILIAVALVVWGVLGFMDTTLAKRELATFKLEYSEDSDVAFIDGGQVVDGAVEVEMYVPGSESIGVQWDVELDLSFFADLFGTEFTVLDVHHTYWQIWERKNTPGTVLAQYWFKALGTDGETEVEYQLQMPGMFEGDNFLPDSVGDITTVSSSGEAELSVTKGKYKKVGRSWTGNLNWTLTIERVEPTQ